AALDEIYFVKAPVVRGEVHVAAAYHSPVNDRRLNPRFRVWCLAKCGGLFTPIVDQSVLLKIFYLIVVKVLLFQIRPLFENDDLKPDRGQPLRNTPASGAGTDYHKVHLRLRLKLRSL